MSNSLSRAESMSSSRPRHKHRLASIPGKKPDRSSGEERPDPLAYAAAGETRALDSQKLTE